MTRRVPLTSTQSSLQHALSTQGPYLFSLQNPKLQQKAVTSSQIRHVQKWFVEVTDSCWSYVSKWQICLKVTCWSDRCVEVRGTRFMIGFQAFSSHLLFSHVLWTLFKKGCSQLEQGLPLTVVDIVPVYTVGKFPAFFGDQQFSELKGASFSNGLWQMATPLFCMLNEKVSFSNCERKIFTSQHLVFLETLWYISSALTSVKKSGFSPQATIYHNHLTILELPSRWNRLIEVENLCSRFSVFGNQAKSYAGPIFIGVRC